jgi:hypothetical protein
VRRGSELGEREEVGEGGTGLTREGEGARAGDCCMRVTWTVATTV